MKDRRKGSITVFMSLMLMLVASLLFTLLECSRYIMLGMEAELNSQSVTESVFAEYNVPAYQNYHLFLMDSGYGSGQLMLSKINAHMQELGQENLNPTVLGFGKYSNFFQMNVTDSSVIRYELATDGQASVLLKQVVDAMKGETGVDLAQKAFAHMADVEESDRKGKEADKCLDGALDTLEHAQEEQAADFDEDDSGMEENNAAAPLPDAEIVNPMDDVKSAKRSPLLAQILAGDAGISAKKTAKADAIENRGLNSGNYAGSHSVGFADKALLIQYFQKYLSNYRNKTNMPHALAYEQEYLLFGKYSDEDNLEKMAGRMLLLREGINFAYLLTDSIKCEEALAAATAIAAAMLVPVAITPIQMGILASWAYAESILELRTLFAGGKIAAVKTFESWTVSLPEVGTVLFHTARKSKEVSGGMDYEQYLQAFLALESVRTIGPRFANLLEKNLRLYAGYEQVKLDCMITAMETGSSYHAQQVFLSFVTIGNLSKKGYKYEKTYEFSYLR